MREGARQAIILAAVVAASLSLVILAGGLLSGARTARLQRLASGFAAERGMDGRAERARSMERESAYRVFALRRQGRLSGFVFFLEIGRGARSSLAMLLADGEGQALAFRLAEGRGADLEESAGKPAEKLAGEAADAWNERLSAILGEAWR